MKYLLLLLVVGALWWSWKKRQLAAGSHREAPPAAVNTLRCAHCGVHFPADEAVRAGASVFCCEAHRQARPGA